MANLPPLHDMPPSYRVDLWKAHAASRWRELYPLVEAHVRAYLSTLESGQYVTTVQLVDVLWPPSSGPVAYEEAHARSRLFKALSALAAHGMTSCVTLGPPVKRYGRTQHERRWHRPPDDQHRCPHCGGPL